MVDEALNDALSDFDKLLIVEMQDVDERMHAGFGQIISQNAARGTLQSGATLVQIAAEAAKTIPVRAQVAMQLMTRTFVAHGVGISSENEVLMIEKLRQCIENYRVQLRSTVQRTAPFKGTNLPGKEQALGYVDQKAAQEKLRIEGEISLFVAASKRQVTEGDHATSGQVFNAPVGVVQIGAHNTATNHQQIGSEGKRALSDAFAKVVAALEADSSGLTFNAEEVRDLAVEGKKELALIKPNNMKIAAYLEGIGKAIAFVPRLREAYDTLKWAAAFLGISLP